MYDLLSVRLLESCCFKKLIPVFFARNSCTKKLNRVVSLTGEGVGMRPN